MKFVRACRRPGSEITAAAAVAFTIVAVAKELDWPKEWWTADWGISLYLSLLGIMSVGAFLSAWGYRRSLGRDTKTEALEKAARAFAELVERETSLRKAEYGVIIWLVRGMPGFRRLVRGPHVTEQHSHMPIVWTKGKGIIGQAWKRKRTRYADLDTVRELYRTKRLWCGQGREGRFRLSWAEFSESRRYRAVIAVPLRVRLFARYRVRGVVALDALVPGKGAELEALEQTPEFSSIRRVCESSFARDD